VRGAAEGNVSDSSYKEQTSLKADHVYKRCYIDNQGNFIDPRTFWDELLKYCRPGEMLLISEGERRLMVPVPVKARREIKLEKAQRARLAQIHWMEARYLKDKGEARKRSSRKRAYELETQYLKTKKRKKKA
jgi:hypothetical protein